MGSNDRVLYGCVSVLVHYFNGVNVKCGGRLSPGLAGAFSAGHGVTLLSRARKLGCCCLTEGNLEQNGELRK